MTIVWAVLGVAAALGAAVVMKILTDETCGWIGRIPFLILRVAVSRVSTELRADLHEEWKAELIHELRDTDERPITRVIIGTRYAASLVWGSKKAADELGATREDRQSEDKSAESKIARTRHERLSDDIDAILDQIDETLEENSEEFVRSYVHPGGQ